jgi:NitT/TauT family transport system permease protein
MRRLRLRFSPALLRRPAFTAGDGLILLGIAALLYAGARLAFAAPRVIAGPAISTSPRALPWYALLSIGRMTAAYALSLGFSLVYGYAAARNRSARRVLMPLLDVLQSVPILSFLPVVLLGLSAVLPAALAAEIAAVVLIFTSQVWNLTFSFYQSMTTVPEELREAAAVFRFDPWLRLKTLELPFAALGLVWNSIMSWAGGWFFLMAAEIFNVGPRDFRLPGLGSYLQTAADAGDLRAVTLGLATLTLIIVLLDQLVWRPLLAWADRFKLEMVEGDEPPTAWFLDVLAGSFIVRRLGARLVRPLGERLDDRLRRRAAGSPRTLDAPPGAGSPSPVMVAIGAVLVAAIAYGAFRAAQMLALLPAAAWARLGLGLLATLGRVGAALLLALLWTVPVGVLIGTNRRLRSVLQPLVQIAASIPATALFPVLVLALLRLPGGLDLAAVLLMLMGTQWYLLFNVIAGAAAIPLDLCYTTDLLRLPRLDRWRTLILPSLFPYIITGAITASGGAWNASIVAEHAVFGGRTYATLGAGAIISGATARGDYPLLLGGTLAMVVTVVAINRVFWRRLYRLAEERYRME